MVTKQHFIQTAAIIKRARDFNASQYDDPKSALTDININKRFVQIAEFFADEYENENERFDRVKFMKACGFGGACNCPRIARRMECNDCGYPLSEAMNACYDTTPCGCLLHR